MNRPWREVRAVYDDSTVTVYQAFSPAIAEPAVAAQRFVPPFGMNRMTWIKPSFLWMMYRCGWGAKPGQERVLAIRMTRAGLLDALRSACVSHFDAEMHRSEADWRADLAASPVRVQWDPERDLAGRPMAWRSLQVGLSGPAVERYVHEWIVGVEDITSSLGPRRRGDQPLPVERVMPLPEDVAARIGARD